MIMKIVDGSKYLEQVKDLIVEYTQFLNRDLSFQNLEAELNDLKSKYTGNHGRILVAVTDDNQVVGCVAFYRHDQNRCEMKRLYVRPQYRNQKIASSLVSNIIKEAKNCGYQEMVLDTIKPLKAAISLYQQFGFQKTQPYYHNPMDDVLYFKLSLNGGENDGII